MPFESTQAEINLLQQSFGTVSAPTVVNTTGATPVTAVCFQVWDSTTKIASITINGTVITAFSALTLPQGFCVYGVISSITLSAGSGLAYSGSNVGLQ